MLNVDEVDVVHMGVDFDTCVDILAATPQYLLMSFVFVMGRFERSQDMEVVKKEETGHLGCH